MSASAHHGSHWKIPLEVMGFDVSITQPIVIMWGVCLLIFLLLLAANQFKVVRQIEALIYDFVSESFAKSIKTKNTIWPSFLITLFLFVFFNNLAGLIPGGESPNSNINVTAALAIFVFILAHVIGFVGHGTHHLKHFAPEGIPKPMLLFFVPLEIISQLARPFSLAVRLFANLMAGHQVLMIFVSLVMMSPALIKALPFTGVVLISLFEMFVSFIQAFIFTYLASFYISDSANGAH
jgi:F-type H+-transporting ATPase subunit a